MWSSHVESGSNMPETQQNPEVHACIQWKDTIIMLQHLKCGEHDAVFAVLDTGVHQVFNQADLWPQVPDSEDQMKHFLLDFYFWLEPTQRKQILVNHWRQIFNIHLWKLTIRAEASANYASQRWNTLPADVRESKWESFLFTIFAVEWFTHQHLI